MRDIALRDRLAYWRAYERAGRPARETRTPEELLASVGWVYEMLPPASRTRPVDAAGVGRMHMRLAGLGGGPQ